MHVLITSLNCYVAKSTSEHSLCEHRFTDCIFEGQSGFSHQTVQRKTQSTDMSSSLPKELTVRTDMSDLVNAWDGIRDHFTQRVQVVEIRDNFPCHRYKLAHETVCPYARGTPAGIIYYNTDGSQKHCSCALL
jgi:hypothetical protein